MDSNKTFCSEAQAYQAIRKDWKERYNRAQRSQTCYRWEADTGEKHPQIVRFVSAAMKIDYTPKFPKLDIMELWRMVNIHQDDASKYAQWLNRYKVKREESNESL
jgi:hypothetical protein